MKKLILFTLTMLMLLTACNSESAANSTLSTTEEVTSEETTLNYQQITQDEAKQIMTDEENYIIIDVRTQSEYDEGHIPNAICVPNETIGSDDITELPDKEQLILVYCRSGRRSKEAAAKLADMGYTNIKEFGGIIDWTGDVVKQDKIYKIVNENGCLKNNLQQPLQFLKKVIVHQFL